MVRFFAVAGNSCLAIRSLDVFLMFWLMGVSSLLTFSLKHVLESGCKASFWLSSARQTTTATTPPPPPHRLTLRVYTISISLSIKCLPMIDKLKHSAPLQFRGIPSPFVV